MSIALPQSRLAYAVTALALITAVVFETRQQDTGLWQAFAFGFGPDLALFLGVGAGLDRGQIHPRAVPAYNLVHMYYLPVALAIAAAVGLVPLGYFVGALAWAFHISLDRTVGYRLRSLDGRQRA
jgi:hypothetical protein